MGCSMHTAYSTTHGVVAYNTPYDTRTRTLIKGVGAPETTITVRSLRHLRRGLELVTSRRTVADMRVAVEAVVFLWRALARRR